MSCVSSPDIDTSNAELVLKELHEISSTQHSMQSDVLRLVSMMDDIASCMQEMQHSLKRDAIEVCETTDQGPERSRARHSTILITDFGEDEDESDHRPAPRVSRRSILKSPKQSGSSSFPASVDPTSSLTRSDILSSLMSVDSMDDGRARWPATLEPHDELIPTEDIDWDQVSVVKTLKTSMNDMDSRSTGRPVPDLRDIRGFLRCKVMDPRSTHRLIFDVAVVCALTYELTMIPVVLAWDFDSTAVLQRVNYCVTIFWTVDIAVNFRTGFLLDGELFMNSRRVAIQYMKTFFALDLVIVMTDWLSIIFTAMSEGEEVSFGGVAGMFRISKLSRLLRIVSLLRIVRMRSRVPLDAFIPASILQHVHLSGKFAKTICLVLTMSHFMSCAWYAMGRSSNRSWLDLPRADGSYHETGFWDAYLTSFHFSIAQVTQGCMDVYPLNYWERTFNILSCLIGLLFGTMLVGSLSATLVRFESMQEERTTKMNCLLRYLRQNNFDRMTQLQVRKQARARLNDEVLLREDQVDILELLSTTLKHQLREELFMPHLRHHAVFRLWLWFDRSASEQLCYEGCKFVYLHLGDDLFTPGKLMNVAYLIVRGDLEYKLHYNFMNAKEKISERSFSKADGKSDMYQLLPRPEALKLKKLDPPILSALKRLPSTPAVFTAVMKDDYVELVFDTIKYQGRREIIETEVFWRMLTQIDGGPFFVLAREDVRYASKHEWVCEAALWCRNWTTVGTLTSLANGCQPLEIDVQTFKQIVNTHLKVTDLTQQYAAAFHNSLISSGVPEIALPDDLQVPFADYSDIVPVMQEHVRSILGKMALQKLHSRFFLRHFSELEQEVAEQTCVLLEDSSGEIVRIINIVAVHIHSSINEATLIQLGSWVDNKTLRPELRQPATRQKKDEQTSSAVHRLIRDLGPLVRDVKFAHVRREVEWKDSQTHRGVRTKYLRNVQVAAAETVDSSERDDQNSDRFGNHDTLRTLRTPVRSDSDYFAEHTTGAMTDAFSSQLNFTKPTVVQCRCLEERGWHGRVLCLREKVYVWVPDKKGQSELQKFQRALQKVQKRDESLYADPELSQLLDDLSTEILQTKQERQDHPHTDYSSEEFCVMRQTSSYSHDVCAQSQSILRTESPAYLQQWSVSETEITVGSPSGQVSDSREVVNL